MKIHNFIIIFLMISLTSFFYKDIQLSKYKINNFNENYIIKTIDNAFSASFSALKTSNNDYGKFGSYNVKIAIDAFFKIFSNSFNLSENDVFDLKMKVKFILIVDNNCYYIYSPKKIYNLDRKELETVETYEKRYFIKYVDGIYYLFSLNDQITVIYKQNDKYISKTATLDELKKEKNKKYEFLNSLNYDIIKEYIKNIIQKDIENVLIEYNKNFFENKNDVIDIFKDNEIIEKSMFVYSTNFNILNYNTKLNEFRKISDKIKETLYYGFKDKILYYTNDFTIADKYEIIKVFNSEKEALVNGYFKYN